MSLLPSRAPSLSTCTIHVPFTCHRGETILRRCHRSARLTYEKGFPPTFPPHDSLTHCLSDYLHFLARHVHVDARCLACWEKDEQSSRKRKELKSIDSRRPRRSKEPHGGASARNLAHFPLFFAACPPINN